MGLDFANSTNMWLRVASGSSSVDESWNTGLYSSGFNTNPLTIGVTFSPDDVVTASAVFSHGRDTNDGWALRVGSDGYLKIWNDLDNSAIFMAGTTALTAGQVYRVIVTISSTAGTYCYLDNTSVEMSSTLAGAKKSMSSAHDWGRYTSLGVETGTTIGSKNNSMNGQIYDFFLSSSIWDSDQIAQYMKGIKYYPLHDSNLVLYYPLDDYKHNSNRADNDIFRDMSGNGYDGKIQQGTTSRGWESRGFIYPSPTIAVISSGASVSNATPTPSSQSVSLTLNAPTIVSEQNVTPTPSSQSVSLTQNAPSVVIGNTVAVDSQSLTLTQNAPTIDATQNPTVTPSSLSVSLTQNAPSVATTGNQTETPASQLVTLTLNAPSIAIVQSVTTTPSNFSVSLTQNAPVINTDSNVTVTPASQTMTLTLNAPIIGIEQDITPTPSSQALNLTLNAPTVVAIQNVTLTPDTQTLTLALQTATGITFVGVSVTQQLTTSSRLDQNLSTIDRLGQKLETI